MSSTSGVSGSNIIRFSGMASGLDTDSIVKQLMSAEKIPYTKLGQKKQLLQWTQDAYREQSTLLSGFKSSYFDVLNPSSNMRSSSIYKQFTATSSLTSVATVVGTSSAAASTHTLVVNQVATTSKVQSTNAVGIVSGTVSNTITAGTFKLNLNGAGDQTITIPAESASVNASGNYDMTNATQKADFLTNLQSSLDSQFGAGVVNAVITSDNKLMFRNSDPTKTLAISSGTLDIGTNLGFTNAAANANINSTLSITTTMSSLASQLGWTGDLSKFNFTINGVAVLGTDGWDITGTGTGQEGGKTLGDLISAVNTSSAGVTMSYNSTTGKFGFETKSTGAASATAFDTNGSPAKLIDSDSGAGKVGVLQSFGLTGANSTTTSGVNASYSLDGVSMSSSGNTFTQDGIAYTVVGTGTTTTTLSQNIDAVVTKVKEFVSKYNDLIAEIQTKLDDKYDKDYPPLTDDQKASMTSDDITKWETKAKTGLLHNDSLLQGVLDDMRNAIATPTNGVPYTLASIGISTGSWYDEGKLNVDETKLRDALSKDIDGVTKLFSNESSIAYNPTDTSDTAAANRTQRFNENGVITRLYDIVNNNVRTTNGKGKLLEKAGLKGDLTEYNNTIYTDIKDVTTRMTDMNERLTEKENAYYKKFASLETYMNSMNSQSSWLTSQLSKM